MYVEDFLVTECIMLEDQLDTFIYDVLHDDDFANIGGFKGFDRKMVEIGKCVIFPIILALLGWHWFC